MPMADKQNRETMEDLFAQAMLTRRISHSFFFSPGFIKNVVPKHKGEAKGWSTFSIHVVDYGPTGSWLAGQHCAAWHAYRKLTAIHCISTFQGSHYLSCREPHVMMYSPVWSYCPYSPRPILELTFLQACTHTRLIIWPEEEEVENFWVHKKQFQIRFVKHRQLLYPP